MEYLVKRNGEISKIDFAVVVNRIDLDGTGKFIKEEREELSWNLPKKMSNSYFISDDGFETLRKAASKHYGRDFEIKDITPFVKLKLTKKQENELLKIGNEVASTWGAYCESFDVYPNLVVFNCNERGEKFTTQMNWDDLKIEYGLSL